jgi:opacity protein-like surface antigen
MRSRFLPILFIGISSLAFTAVPCLAQGFGIGARMTMMKSDTDSFGDDESTRFTGIHVRMRSPRAGLELSLDRHSEEFDSLDQKVTELPIQASVLLYPVKGAFSPYLLGGPGWYRTKVDSLSDDDAESISTRTFGWHAGFGAELVLGRHAGIHADYRYTFLNFGDDDDDDEDGGGLFGSVMPRHKGSMWTAGFTFYF